MEHKEIKAEPNLKKIKYKFDYLTEAIRVE